MKNNSSILYDAIAKSSQRKMSFEDSRRYNKDLEHTFLRTFNDVCKIGSGLSILDVGSFTGVVSVALKKLGNEVTACDIDFVINDAAIQSIFKEENIKSCRINLQDNTLPFSGESFDLIIFNEVIEHLNFNPIPLLREFNRILKINGKIYCATPNLISAKNICRMLTGKGYLNPIEHLIWNLEPGTGMSVGLHWREWSREELVELFKCAGFGYDWHKFGLITPNRSKFPRNIAVKLMYLIFPRLMPNQVALFKKL